jgi:hypothetical protein
MMTGVSKHGTSELTASAFHVFLCCQACFMLAAARQVISNDRAARSLAAGSGWVAAVYLLLHTALAVVFAGRSTGPSNGIGAFLCF